jgi:hypothetical protein
MFGWKEMVVYSTPGLNYGLGFLFDSGIINLRITRQIRRVE